MEPAVWRSIQSVPFRSAIRDKALDHHQTTDLLLEVAPACADDLREPLTKLVDLDGDFLRASAQSANHADLSPPDGVGGSRGLPLMIAVPQSGPHHQQAFFDCLLLERRSSSSTGTLSENSMTCKPASSASSTSAAAY